MKNDTKYLLIGGGLASCEAVKGIREHDSQGTITMVGREPHLPYNRPPLSKALIKGEKKLEECFCESPAFYKEQKVELCLAQSVVQLDVEKRKAVLDNEWEISFDKALLATGGTPNRLPIKGMDLENVYSLRTLEDSIAIQKAARPLKRAVVIGGGFIGMEISASLCSIGVNVTVIEVSDRLWPRVVNTRLAEELKQYYQKKGIMVLTGEKVVSISKKEEDLLVNLQSEREFHCDLVICAAGIKPNVELAEQAGLNLDNGVVVNSRMQTSNPNIYAAGDIANYPDPYFDKRRRVEHWGQAEYSGGLAGKNMAGADRKYDLLTYFWSEGFDLHYEFAGEDGVYDKTIMRGHFLEDNFAELYLKNNRLRGFLAVNPDKKTLSALESLVQSQIDLSGREDKLAQSDIELSKLAKNK